MTTELSGSIHSINVSNGGVPKLPRQSTVIRSTGCDGDRQRNLVFHGGPTRAVCLYSLERIEALRAEGHPIHPGAIGENLTLAGLDWHLVGEGALLQTGDVHLEITRPASPCKHIAPYLLRGEIDRVSEKKHPGWSRWYCRVVVGGPVTVGDEVRIIKPRDVEYGLPFGAQED